MAHDDLPRQAQFSAEFANLVLEQAAQRLDQFELHFLRQAADVVMALDQRRRIATDRDRLDDVGIQRALCEKFCLADLACGFLENIDERVADNLALCLGIGDATQFAYEQIRRVLVVELDLEIAAKNFFDNARLVGAQHAVVHKDAGQLLADGLVNERRRHAGIHTAAQAEDHFFLADLDSDLLDGLLDIAAHRPLAAAAADFAHEV